MAHQVTFALPERELANADLEIYVRKNEELLGTLYISKGGIVWAPRHAKKGIECDWATFDKLMKQQAHE